MPRVDCPRCRAVIVEEVPWGDGKRTLTKGYMLYLARWARQLSWKETAEAFRTSWDKAFDAVEHVVNKAKVTMRKAYGFRTFRVLELALYHSLAKLPQPETTHEFF